MATTGERLCPLELQAVATLAQILYYPEKGSKLFPVSLRACHLSDSTYMCGTY